MAWVRARGHCNYLHKGDIGHRLFNGCYGYDPADMMRYWLDEAGEICAFAMLYPHWEAFDLQVAPALRLSGGHVRLVGLLRKRNPAPGRTFWHKHETDCD